MALAWQPVDLTEDPDELRFEADPAELIGAVGALLDQIRRPAWHAQAACRGEGPERWFPGRGGDPRPVYEVCQRCPVQVECLASGQGEAGIWGGTSETGRRQLVDPRPDEKKKLRNPAA